MNRYFWLLYYLIGIFLYLAVTIYVFKSSRVIEGLITFSTATLLLAISQLYDKKE